MLFYTIFVVMILLVDNNDSFTYNIVDLLRGICREELCVKNSRSMSAYDAEEYSHIILSLGPGLPGEFPVMEQILELYSRSRSILGICLGHQAICLYYGGSLMNLPQVAHGLESMINCDTSSVLFDGVGQMVVGRYHSWAADRVPEQLRVSARDGEGVVMAVEHIELPIFGVQFHPESYMTKDGITIFRNFLNS